MHQSIASTNIPSGQPPEIFPNFQPGSRDLYHLQGINRILAELSLSKGFPLSTSQADQNTSEF